MANCDECGAENAGYQYPDRLLCKDCFSKPVEPCPYWTYPTPGTVRYCDFEGPCTMGSNYQLACDKYKARKLQGGGV